MPFCNRQLILVLLIAVGCLASPAWADAELKGTQPAQWRLLWKEDPAHRATLSWSTAAAGSNHKVMIHAKGDKGWKEVAARSGQYSGDGKLFYHHAQLTDLAAGTAYEVKMVSDEDESPLFYFVTAPDTDRPLSIIFGGDSRSDQPTRRKVNTMISEMVHTSSQSDNEFEQIIAFAHGGDYIVSGKSLEQWSAWLSDHELTVTKDNRLLPLIAARGNHDVSDLFLEVFDFADRNIWYATSISPQIRFITLNTETSASGEQAVWLGKELADSRKTNRWLLAQYHRPAFPAVKSPSAALRYWVPLFEKFNVDLVCEADGHNIKRTVPIRNEKEDPTGVTYIGEGGLGVPQRTPKTDRWFLKAPGMASKGHHVQKISFAEDRLLYQCVMLGGEVFDSHELKPRK